MSAEKKQDFIHVTYPEPHLKRAKEIMKAHPEVRSLFGNTPSTSLYIYGVVLFQTAMAIWLKDSAWWLILGLAFVVGAVADHALFVLIHECAHNLVFKGSRANRVMGIIANLPIIFPAAMGFRTFHLLHHRYQGEWNWDADLPGPLEAKLVGRNFITKSIWFIVFFLVEGLVRPNRLKSVRLIDRWVILNLIVEVGFLVGLFAFFGWGSFFYLMMSTVFSVGFHPLGARWIQEHYVMVGNQETYSYYGGANFFAFNVGYHNEHHDLMMVAWSRLPKLKAMAPEFYDNLYAHHSWTKLFLQFLFTPDFNLKSRVVRPDHVEVRAAAMVPQEEMHQDLVTSPVL